MQDTPNERRAAQARLLFHRQDPNLDPQNQIRAGLSVKDAGLRDGRLHDSRHTAAALLLILGVPERAVMGVMGWSTTAMAAHYQHVTGSIRDDVAERVGGLIWGTEDKSVRGSRGPR
jgi:integrase